MCKVKLAAITFTVAILLVSCAKAEPPLEAPAQSSEVSIPQETDSKSVATKLADESNSESDATVEKEQSIAEDIPIDFTMRLELGFEPEDGKFYEIPRLSEEEEEAFIKSDNCAESIKARLESYGIFLDSNMFLHPDVMKEDSNLSYIEYSFLPMFISQYKDFDLLHIRYPGYRGAYSGSLYVFERSVFKGVLMGGGEIDLDNAFRAIGEHIWLATKRHNGGTGMGMVQQEWISLTDEGLPLALRYPSYYGTNNYSFGLDYDPGVYPSLHYNATEEKLYINEQNIPVLRVKWQKEVYVYVRMIVSDEERLPLISNGYDEHIIDTSIDWDAFTWSSPISGKLLDGLEEQIDELIKHGTEEEKHIAQQLVENYITMPAS